MEASALRPVLRTLVEHAAAERVGGAFDASRLDSDGQAAVAHAINRCEFDFSRLGVVVLIRSESLGQEGLLATAHRDPPTIVLDRSLRASPKEEVATVFLEEAAHMVDWFVLTAQQRREIFLAYHGGADKPHGHAWGKGDYWAQVAESFMAGFVMAYSDLIPDQRGFDHQTSRAVAREIRRIIG